jgi:hypothetical protein
MLKLALILSITIGKAETFYIKSLQAPLLESPEPKAKIKMAISRGTEVSSVKIDDLFVKVSFNNQEGFINKLFLSTTPVINKSSLLNENVDITSKARKRASGFTSAAAARGLKEDSDDIFKNLGDADVLELKKMEALQVNEKLAFKFLLNPNGKIEETKQ